MLCLFRVSQCFLGPSPGLGLQFLLLQSGGLLSRSGGLLLHRGGLLLRLLRSGGHLLCRGGLLLRLLWSGGLLPCLLCRGDLQLCPGGLLFRLLRPGGLLSRLLRPGGLLSRLLRPGGLLSHLLRPGGLLSRLLRPGGLLSRLLRLGGLLSRLLCPGGLLFRRFRPGPLLGWFHSGLLLRLGALACRLCLSPQSLHFHMDLALHPSPCSASAPPPSWIGGGGAMSQILSMNFCLLATRGHSLAALILALHYCHTAHWTAFHYIEHIAINNHTLH